MHATWQVCVFLLPVGWIDSRLANSVCACVCVFTVWECVPYVPYTLPLLTADVCQSHSAKSGFQIRLWWKFSHPIISLLSLLNAVCWKLLISVAVAKVLKTGGAGLHHLNTILNKCYRLFITNLIILEYHKVLNAVIYCFFFFFLVTSQILSFLSFDISITSKSRLLLFNYYIKVKLWNLLLSKELKNPWWEKNTNSRDGKMAIKENCTVSAKKKRKKWCCVFWVDSLNLQGL